MHALNKDGQSGSLIFSKYWFQKPLFLELEESLNPNYLNLPRTE